MEKRRHGFVTFWLGFMCVVNLIYGLYAAYQLISGIGMGNAGVQVVGTIGCLVNFVASIMMLEWKKMGFWIFTTMSIIGCISNIILFQQLGYSIVVAMIAAVIATGLSLLILWAVLQIKKDGISCWKQLE